LENGVAGQLQLADLGDSRAEASSAERVERAAFSRAVDQVHIKVADAQQPAQAAFRRHQKKIVLRKMVARNATPPFDEQTNART